VGERGLLWLPLRDSLGTEAFGANAYTAAEAGQEVVEEHDELGAGAGHHEELYVVVSGRARFTVDGAEVDAPSGTCVFVADPAERRGAVAEESGTIVLALGGARGVPFRVSAWEYSFQAEHAARQGDVERARAVMAEGLASYPENATLHYNLACFLSLAGARDDALLHLRRALELDPGLARHAGSDADLEPLRDDPRFPAP
jgi:tetratricopeptide (TPR) repeat protein